MTTPFKYTLGALALATLASLAALKSFEYRPPVGGDGLAGLCTHSLPTDVAQRDLMPIDARAERPEGAVVPRLALYSLRGWPAVASPGDTVVVQFRYRNLRPWNSRLRWEKQWNVPPLFLESEDNLTVALTATNGILFDFSGDAVSTVGRFGSSCSQLVWIVPEAASGTYRARVSASVTTLKGTARFWVKPLLLNVPPEPAQ